MASISDFFYFGGSHNSTCMFSGTEFKSYNCFERVAMGGLDVVDMEKPRGILVSLGGEKPKIDRK